MDVPGHRCGNPCLPPWLEEVELRGLHVGRGRLGLLFRKEGERTVYSVPKKDGDLLVVMED